MDNKQFDSKLKLSVFITSFLEMEKSDLIRHSIPVSERWSNSAFKTVSGLNLQQSSCCFIGPKIIIFYLLDMIFCYTYWQEGKMGQKVRWIELDRIKRKERINCRDWTGAVTSLGHWANRDTNQFFLVIPTYKSVFFWIQYNVQPRHLRSEFYPTPINLVLSQPTHY